MMMTGLAFSKMVEMYASTQGGGHAMVLEQHLFDLLSLIGARSNGGSNVV